ncbi:MAG: M48 family metalloprotease, partial [Rickettsiales bacterium]
MFIHTGLLMQANAPGEVIGVLAHEIGHITGGHLARMHQGLKDATNQSILALVLGGAAALASGSPDVLVAGATASASVGQRSFLSYTRTMEQSADQAALAFLDSTEQSAQGLLDFLELLSKQEKIFTAGGNPYMKSHPLTTARIDHVREHIRKSPYSSKETDLLLRSMHDRMRGKLKGFI